MMTRLLGTAGLVTLATGVPTAFRRLAEASVPRARANYPYEASPGARFVIMSTGRHGDPLNANVPGSFEDPAVVHPSDPEAQASDVRLGDVVVKGAHAWSTLPRDVLARTCFVHGTTGSTAHLELPGVLSLMGAATDGEMLPSIYARALAPRLETALACPISLLGKTSFAEEFISFEGHALPNDRALTMRSLLAQTSGPLATLRHLRDRAIDTLHARLKATGTPEQRAFVDRVALTGDEARVSGEKVLACLQRVSSDDANGQVVMAAVLIKLKIAPVVVVQIPFGGDNHGDPGLLMESTQLVSGVQQLGALMATLRELGIHDDTTFMTLGPFGRTLRELGDRGRNHSDHHASVVIGPGIRPGVVGGIAPVDGKDFTPLGIDSRTGRAVVGACDVPRGDTLASLAKTVGVAAGIPVATLDGAITRGKVLPAALVS